MRAHFLELTSQVGKYVHEYSINHSVMPLAVLLLKIRVENGNVGIDEEVAVHKLFIPY